MSLKCIRRGVFETNSSSVHSITIAEKTIDSNSMMINDDGYIEVGPGEFGWGVERHRDQTTKLEYLVMMAFETEFRDHETREYKCESIEDFYNTEGFHRISSEISSYCNCKGIVCTGFNIEKHTYTHEGEERFYINHEGYIDHQSCEDYKNLQDFLDDHGVSVVEFVFNPRLTLHISNDNM